METATDDISDSESDIFNVWKANEKCVKHAPKSSVATSEPFASAIDVKKGISSSLLQKFELLKQRSNDMLTRSKHYQERTEKWRTRRLIKKAFRDPLIKKMVESKEYDITEACTNSAPCAKEHWTDIKPFLTVNDHLQGPVSHGDCGPKTELETLVDEAIKEGDFTKAEVLSDTLANRQFAVKIAHAFEAKRFAEKRAAEEEDMKAKRLKKLSWGFEAKERWQMKGNM